jgi:molybdate transport system ATP-binding protein
LAQLELDITVPLRAFSVDAALTVAEETVALVGPSGAGKTTVLRAVAGLHRPAAGRIALDGDVWFDGARGIDRPPERRSVGLVFQEYALFPHMTVAANVGFGGRGRVDDLLGRLGIAQLAHEKPGRLSGGERQRVAVARALARDPAVLLLDEPLSALDAHTRSAVREQLADVLAGLRIPALIVTHDFTDAAALAPRVGVLLEGRLHQLGRPAELLARPADRFVAALTGGNLLTGEAAPDAEGGSVVQLDDGGTIRSDERASGRVGVTVHPWDVAIADEPPADGANALPGAIGATILYGGRARVRVGALLAERPVGETGTLVRGATVYASFSPADTRLVPLDPAEEVTT